MVVVVVAAIAAPFVYIHFIEGPPPAKLTLPHTTSTTSPGAKTSPTSSSSLDGTWNVGTGSMAGYRVNEDLVGQHTTAVGRTSDVWGSLVLSGTHVTSAKFTVAMATVKSDQSQRNAQFDGRIMDVSRYPTATFTLTTPIDLSSTPTSGVTNDIQRERQLESPRRQPRRHVPSPG